VSAEWNMPRRTDACAGCGRAFEFGETFQAFLYELDGSYTRRDYCTACQPPAVPAAVGAWKTRRPAPAPRAVRPFDREAILAFFERLEDAVAAQQVQLRFVLALLLWRKKALKLERTAQLNGRETWEFTAPRTGTLHRVVRPELDEEELERLSEQLEHLLAGEPVAGGKALSDCLWKEETDE